MTSGDNLKEIQQERGGRKDRGRARGSSVVIRGRKPTAILKKLGSDDYYAKHNLISVDRGTCGDHNSKRLRSKSHWIVRYHARERAYRSFLLGMANL